MNHLNEIERAMDICIKLKLPVNGDEFYIILTGIREAMRDQRHACAEALGQVENVPEEAHNMVFNAHVEGWSFEKVTTPPPSRPARTCWP